MRKQQIEINKAEKIKQAKLMNNLLSCYRRHKNNLFKKKHSVVNIK